MEEYWAHRLRNTRPTLEGEVYTSLFDRYTPHAAKVIWEQWNQASNYDVSDETSAEDLDEGIAIMAKRACRRGH